MIASEFLACDRAGLQLAGVSADGELERIGTIQQWQQVDQLEAEICLNV